MKRRSLREDFPILIDRVYELFRQRRFVEDVMSKEVVMINLEATMGEASRIMGAKRIGSLIVEAKGKPVGIVTERDLLSKVFAKGKDYEKVGIRDVMSSPLIKISPELTIKEAARTMIAQKSRLAVFREETLVGIITAADLIKSLPESPETLMSVDEVMTKPVVMVPSNTSVEDVTKIMGEKRIGSVIIIKRGKPFGIFTERDLLTTFLTRGKSLKTKVGTAASSPLITIPVTSIHQAALTMSLKHIRRLPVVVDDKIVGIVTARDLVEAYAR